MEQKRLQLSTILHSIMTNGNVYFCPPDGKELRYPCIVYELSDLRARRADNLNYLKNLQYTVTLIDEDPDSEFVEKILEVPKCRFDRPFISDNLNHFVFTIYI